MSPFRARAHRLFRSLGAAALLLASACGGDGPTGPVPADEVRVSNNRFSPATRSVATGTTVTFRWSASAATHNVTFNDGPASANQSSGTFQRTFNTVGTFPYQCTLHGGMTGTITVSTEIMAAR